MIKIIGIPYTKAELEHVDDNVTQLNDEDRTQLLGLRKYFGGFFDGTLGDWGTDPVNLELKPDYKPFYCKYYPVPRIKKDTFLWHILHPRLTELYTNAQHLYFYSPT